MNELVTRDQPRGHSTAAGNLDSAKKPDVPRRTILTVTHEARCPEAITAMAHRLARLVCRMLKYGRHYLDKDATYCDQRNRQQQIDSKKGTVEIHAPSRVLTSAQHRPHWQIGHRTTRLA